VSLNAVNSRRVLRRRRWRSPAGGALRTLRYPFDRCLACQQPVAPDAAAQEAALTVYEPRAVVTIRFRVCQRCAQNLDAHADAPRLLRHLATWYTCPLRPLSRHPRGRLVSTNPFPRLSQNLPSRRLAACCRSGSPA
jgi:hypothetical protein